MKLKETYNVIVGKLPFLQKTWFLFLVILISASLWRLTYMSLVEFKGDEALNLFLATRFLFGHSFPPASLASSVGILNFPLLNYFLFPITLISYYPPFVSGCIAFLNVLAISAYFLLISKYFNRLTGFISALFLSLAPWAILYSRKIWAQDFLIPLVVALLFCFFQIYKGKKQIYWLFFGITSLFLIQIHQTAGILPVLLFFPLVKKQKPHLLFLIIGILAGLLPTIPYILYEFINKCPDCTTISLLHTKLQQFHPDIFLRIFQIITTSYFHTIFGNTDNLLFTTLYPFTAKITKASYLMYLALPTGMALFWLKYKEYRSFVNIICIALIVFFFLKIQPEMHYVIIFLPFLFLFLGNLFASGIFSKKIFFKIAAIFLTFLFVVTYLTFDYSFFNLLSIKKGFGGDYGGTYAVAADTAHKALEIYKRNSGYQEMTLAYYIPKDSIQGDTPVGQILYPLSILKQQVNSLNKMLEIQGQHPDPRILNELLAYYTYPQNETHTNIFFLKDKAKKSDAYLTIYNATLNDYLSTHHNHFFNDTNIWIEFPEHWKQIVSNNSLTLSDENVSFNLFFSEQKLPGLTIQQHWQTRVKKLQIGNVTFYECSEENVWCGSYIPSLIMNGKTYAIAMLPQSKNISPQVITNEKKVLYSVLESLVPAVY